MLAITVYKLVLQIYFGFVVLTGVTMKSIFFWDVAPYIPIENHGRFGGTCCFLLRDL
jgi:hypothetical protein